jgi:hypothetical protein
MGGVAEERDPALRHALDRKVEQRPQPPVGRLLEEAPQRRGGVAEGGEKLAPVARRRPAFDRLRPGLDRDHVDQPAAAHR